MGREGRFDRGRTGQKGRAPVLVRLCWLKGVIAEKRAFCRGSTGLHGCSVVLGRMDWADGGERNGRERYRGRRGRGF